MDEVVLSEIGDFRIFVGLSKAYISIHIVVFKPSSALNFICVFDRLIDMNYARNMKYQLMNSFSSLYDYVNPL